MRQKKSAIAPPAIFSLVTICFTHFALLFGKLKPIVFYILCIYGCVWGKTIVKILLLFHPHVLVNAWGVIHPLRIGQYVGGESPPRIDQYVGGKTHMLMIIYDFSYFKSRYGFKNIYDFKE